MGRHACWRSRPPCWKVFTRRQTFKTWNYWVENNFSGGREGKLGYGGWVGKNIKVSRSKSEDAFLLAHPPPPPPPPPHPRNLVYVFDNHTKFKLDRTRTNRNWFFAYCPVKRTGSLHDFSQVQISHKLKTIQNAHITWTCKHNPKVSLFGIALVKNWQIKLGDADTVDRFGLACQYQFKTTIKFFFFKSQIQNTT